MCKIIDFTSRLVNEEKIHWDIMIGSDQGADRYRIRKISSGDNNIIITIATTSFDKIIPLRDAALAELKQQLLKNEVKCVGEH